jgi:CBS domain containing-hemolysin-like protein
LLVSRKQHQGANETITQEEFHSLIHSNESMHNLDEHEKKILAGLFRLPKAEIREIYIPRVDVTAIEESLDMTELKKLIITSGYSRIPVYRSSIDDVVGIAYAKDILLHPEKDRITDLMRPAWFVTENMKIQTLLNQFKSKKTQIAVVVDEYGGTSGIITLEDIMEELVGEIHDEYDDDETPDLQRLDANTILVNGMCAIRDLNTEMHIDINPEAFDNIADFLLDSFNHVPRINEKLVYQGRTEFCIIDSDKKRISKIRITDLGMPEEEIE